MPVDRCLERVDLFLTAKNLPNLHTFNVTDPFAVVFVKTRENTLQKIGTTELIMNNLNPTWAKAITVDYLFEAIQTFVVIVYHGNKNFPISDESKHDVIGQSEFVMSKLMCAHNQSLPCELVGAGKSMGLTIRGEIQANTRDLFCVTFSANKLVNKEGFFSKSDPFLTISRMNEDGTFTQTWKNLNIHNTLSPKWAETKISMTSLCNGDIDRPLRITIWDYESNGKHVFMGQIDTSVRSMLTSNGSPLDVIEPEKKAKKGYTNSGTLMAGNCSIEHHPTFSDFIAGGCEISLVVAIDFTGSNGEPKNPSSLHYVDPSGVRLNQYQEAIVAVGNILEPYDTDNMYPVYGFGARVKLPNGDYTPVQHCFPVYGGSLEVKGVEGLLKAYKDCLDHVMLSGPTLFTPLINASTAVAHNSRCSQEKQKYTILLILTDGAINDMEATKQAIIEASHAPLSIIIIGVGSADFSGMKELDSDGKMLQAGGKTASRDIVQFVSFRDEGRSGSSVLAQQVLAEVPTQLIQYMEQRNFRPNPKK